MANREEFDPTKIPGWGVDADPKNDPTYPMKRRTNAEHEGYAWERPTQQPIDREILHSNERFNITATFGDSTPPSGLSGMLRRMAFKYSESSYGHWLPLMLADRVNVVEGIVDDVLHGKAPNPIKERGWGAEWEHDRPRVLGKVLVGGVLMAGAAALLRGKRK